ncbi:SRPBCC family protein [Salinimicrobium flavum]|uniref:SRPBCC domain-containing protein n=1 Tax=Salinimicrobium flavum TaxID=1737065 RepID=A0ABW5J227_9FLAO
MKKDLAIDFSVDRDNNIIRVKKEFSAPVSRVWKAWTQQELLDQWWAPEPWKCETKSMDFREGGKWIYAMVGPNGEKHWSQADYQSVKTLISFTGYDAFIDEKGNRNTGLPESSWKVEFEEDSVDTTRVTMEIEHESREDLEKILEMGFQEGFTSALTNLDQLLEKEEE